MEYVQGVQKVSSIFVGRAIQTEWGGGAATNGGAKQILQHKPPHSTAVHDHDHVCR